MDSQELKEMVLLAKISEEAQEFANKKIEMFEEQLGKVSQQTREVFLVAGAVQYFYNLITENDSNEEEDDFCDDDCDEKFSSNRDALETLLKALAK